MRYPFQFKNNNLNREYSKILEFDSIGIEKGDISETEFVIDINDNTYTYSSKTERDEDYDMMVELTLTPIQLSLKNKVKTNPENVRIFSTGCNLTPRQLKNGKWAWVVDTFEEDSFYQGDDVNVSSLWSDLPEDLVVIEEE